MSRKNKNKQKVYRLTIVRTYIADEVYVKASSALEAKEKYIHSDFEWIETGSDKFNRLFELRNEEILDCEEEKEN